MAIEQTRLVDDGTIPQSLRAALEEDAAMDPTPDELAQMSVALGVVAAPTALAPVAASKLASLLPIAAAISVVAAGGAVLLWMSQPRAAPVPHKQVSLRVAPPPPIEEPPVLLPPAPETPPTPAVRRAVSRPIDPPGSSSTLGAEMQLISRAERLVSTDPQRALALAQEHQARYPSGLLTEEREVVAIHALVRLGRRAEAQARADTFAREHGSSVHLRRVRRVLADAPE